MEKLLSALYLLVVGTKRDSTPLKLHHKSSKYLITRHLKGIFKFVSQTSESLGRILL